ncbi:MAG: MFS transporter [Acidimicrobiia bacterium]|nr:MFS transporter [Acidimicrobiia bacterium]
MQTTVDDRTRTRLRWVLFAAVGSMTTGYIASITVATLAARAITGSELLAGVPGSLAVISTAVGTSTLGRVVVASGRRRSLVLGTATAVVGAGLSAYAVFLGQFLVLILGMSILGFGNAASHLSRYTAADLIGAERRGRALSLVVWAGTIGAVVGPRLLGPAGRMAADMGASEYAGGYLAGIVAMSLALALFLLALRPDPSTLAVVDDDVFGQSGSAPPAMDVFARRPVQLALAAMVIGQLVMVLIMTATPIHVENNGFDLALVGSIISAHTLGMFAFAPLVGRIVDRIGAVPMIGASAVVLIASALLAATAPPSATTALTVALFLLGIGWNLGFVAGSTLLSVSIEPSIRPLIQGRVDSMVWGSSALASAGSGVLLAGPGYPFLSYLGAGLTLGLVAMLARNRLLAVPVAT